MGISQTHAVPGTLHEMPDALRSVIPIAKLLVSFAVAGIVGELAWRSLLLAMSPGPVRDVSVLVLWIVVIAAGAWVAVEWIRREPTAPQVARWADDVASPSDDGNLKKRLAQAEAERDSLRNEVSGAREAEAAARKEVEDLKVEAARPPAVVPSSFGGPAAQLDYPALKGRGLAHWDATVVAGLLAGRREELLLPRSLRGYQTDDWYEDVTDYCRERSELRQTGVEVRSRVEGEGEWTADLADWLRRCEQHQERYWPDDPSPFAEVKDPETCATNVLQWLNTHGWGCDERRA